MNTKTFRENLLYSCLPVPCQHLSQGQDSFDDICRNSEAPAYVQSCYEVAFQALRHYAPTRYYEDNEMEENQ